MVDKISSLILFKETMGPEMMPHNEPGSRPLTEDAAFMANLDAQEAARKAAMGSSSKLPTMDELMKEEDHKEENN